MADLNDPLLGHLESRLAPVGITDVRALTGGASSLTFAALSGGRRVVVKVAPPGVMPTRHRDVLRQARVIRALGPTAVPVPTVLREDLGNPPEEPPLFVMSHIDGSSTEPLFDDDAPDAAVTPETMAGRMFDAVRVLAELHGLDPSALGLDAEPISGSSEEVDRWCRTLETVDEVLVPGWREVAATLRSTVPAPMPPAIVHGDFRLGNLLARGDRVVGVIDWEIWMVGDPRVDVAWFLINGDTVTYRRSTCHAGTTPAPAELAAEYVAARGSDVPDLDWFQGLACFKSAATWSLIVKHNRRRREPDPALEAMAAVPPALLARSVEFLDGGVPD